MRIGRQCAANKCKLFVHCEQIEFQHRIHRIREQAKNTWIMQFSRGLTQNTEYMHRTIELEDKHDSEDIRLIYSTLHVHIQYTLIVC